MSDFYKRKSRESVDDTPFPLVSRRCVARQPLADPQEKRPAGWWVTSVSLGAESVLATTYGGEVVQFRNSVRMEEEWRLAVGEAVRSAVVRGSEVYALCVDTVRVYGRQGGDLLRKEEFEPGLAVDIAVFKDKYFVAGNGGTIMVCDQAAKRTVYLYPPPSTACAITRMSASKDLLLTAGGTPTVRLYTATLPPGLAGKFDSTDATPVRGVAWDAGGGKFAVSTPTHTEIRHAETLQVEHEFAVAVDGEWQQLAWKAGMCVGASRSGVYVFDTAQKTPAQCFRPDGGHVSALATKDTRIALGTLNGDVLLYDVRNTQKKLCAAKGGRPDIRKSLAV